MTPATTLENWLTLSPSEQHKAHLSLCKQALSVWKTYFAEHAPIEYVESVVGTHQVLDVDLPADALAAIYAGLRAESPAVKQINYRYLEPLSALQDDDLAMPTPQLMAFYAIYNCYELYVKGRKINGELIVKQALRALEET